MRDLERLEDLISQYNYFLLDAYGVFWASAKHGLISGTKEAMKHLVSCQKTVGILSNSTQLASREKEKYAKHGLYEGVHYHFLLTSGEVTHEILSSKKLPFPTPQKKYYLFGTDHPRFTSPGILFQKTEYSRTDSIHEADFIYIAIPHIDGEDQEASSAFLKSVQVAAKMGLPVLCANPDRYAHEGSPPRLVVRQGTIAQLFQEEGSAVFFIGKPYIPIFERALEFFPDHVLPREILMVGDTPETDVRGARQMKIASALVTQTGVMKELIGNEKLSFTLNQLPETDRPDHLIPSLNLHEL